MPPKRVAIIGAGPIGIEAALYAECLGYDVDVFERGLVGDSVRRWGFVTLFSPTGLNTSSLGLKRLREEGRALPASNSYLTGGEYVGAYLEPLARGSSLRGRVHEGHRIVQIARENLGKGLPLGEERAAHPFRLLVEGPDGERALRADIVLDCSGTYGNANWLGTGNIPAPGERASASRIETVLPDLRGADRGRYAGRRVLLAGAGHSAATALCELVCLPGTRTVWIARGADPQPYPLIPDDPLPARDHLSRRANALATAAGGTLRFMPGTCVDSLRETPDGLAVRLLGAAGEENTVTVDRVLALVGYRPDVTLYRELQVHECFATEGPVKLAATLLDAGSADCLAQPSPGVDVLTNPEPDFYVLGAKSYGRNSRFLIRTGLSQVREVFARIEQRPELDLHQNRVTTNTSEAQAGPAPGE